MLNKQLLPLLLTCIAVAVATTAAPKLAHASITCGTVYANLEPCRAYVIFGGSVPLRCCSGLKSLLSSARTIPDLQSACKCMKSVASSASGATLRRAASIPGICKTNLPFKISANIDCSKLK